MAYWQRTTTGLIKIYDSHGRYVPKKREPALYEGLAAEPDHNIDHRVNTWALQTGDTVEKSTIPALDSTWAGLVDGYFDNMKLRSKGRRDEKTAGDHKRALTTFILPYFLTACRLENPNKWPKASDRLMAWMLEQKATPDQIYKANAAVNGFWGYLKQLQRVGQGLGISVLAPTREEKDTPLPRIVEPDEVFRFLKAAAKLPAPANRDIPLMAMLAYFFSLRPQELFALRRRDFVAGSEAAKMLCCKVMSGHTLLLDDNECLYGRLAVEISRQRQQNGKFRAPKAYSRGWVSCFSEEGAKLIVKALRCEPDREAILFRYLNDRQFKWWATYGIGRDKESQSLDPEAPKIALKDFRRSSCAWLGHFTSFGVNELRGHGRWKKEEMVFKYLRRPGEKPNRTNDLDLDA